MKNLIKKNGQSRNYYAHDFQEFFPHVLIILSFLVYIKTICPTIYWRDAPEFANVGYSLGIAHPSGSPTYSLISKIITFIPIGSIGFRINLVSLIFAILSIWILFKIVLSLIYLCSEKTDEKLSRITALCTSLMVIFSRSFWMVSAVAEVYTMNLFGLCLVVYFVIHWIKIGQNRFLFLSTFLYGLSIGIHGGMLLFFPCLFLLFVLVEFPKNVVKNGSVPNLGATKILIKNYVWPPPLLKKAFTHHSISGFKQLLKSSLLLSFLFLLGFSVFLYLPVRSTMNPTFDLGNPETFQRFINHITDRKDSSSFFSDISEAFLFVKNAGLFSQAYIKEFTLIGFLCGIIGFVFHACNHKKTFLLCFLLFFVNILFYLTAKHEPFTNSMISLPSIIIFSFWIGVGVYKILEGLSTLSYGFYLKLVFFVTLSGFIFFSFIKYFNDINKSTFYLADEIPRKMFLSMESNSIVFSSLNWVPFRYFQDTENLKQDISILLVSDLENPFIFNPINAERFPNINLPPFKPNKSNFKQYTSVLIKLNLLSKHIYTGFNKPLNNLANIELLPYKMFLAEVVFRETGDKNRIIDNYLNKLKTILEEILIGKDYVFDQDMGSRTYFSTYLLYISDYLMLQNRFKDAEFFLKIAANINRYANKRMIEMLGACYVNLNQFKDAEEMFEKLIANHPDNPWYFYSLGIANFKLGKLKNAKLYLEKSVALDKNDTSFRLALEQVKKEMDKEKK